MKHFSKLSKASVLLVNPWIDDFAAYDFWMKPLGLLIIGRILRDSGYSISLLDCLDRCHPRLLKYLGRTSAESRSDGTGRFIKTFIDKPAVLEHVPRRFGRYGMPEAVVRGILDEQPEPDVIFVTSGMTYWYTGVTGMITLLKSRFPEVPVVLGGIYASLCTDHARQFSGADYVVPGAGEAVVPGMVHQLTGCDPAPQYHREPDDYLHAGYDLYSGIESAAILTSRGCPYQCPFCGSRLLDGAFRQKEPDDVAEEVFRLSRSAGIRHLAFYDDALLINKETHLKPVLREVIRRPLNLAFHTPNGLHPKEIDNELANLMFQSRFVTIRLSYESSSQTRQRQMGLKVCDGDIEKALTSLENAGYRRGDVACYVLMGLPGQPLDEVLDSLSFILGLGARVSLAAFSPVPGTRCWMEAVQSGVMDENADPLLANNTVFTCETSEVTYDTFFQLGTVTAESNRLLSRGGNPLRDDGIRAILKRIKQS